MDNLPIAYYTCSFSIAMLVYQRVNFRSLLADLPVQRLQATIVSYGAGLNACERAEQWTQAP